MKPQLLSLLFLSIFLANAVCAQSVSLLQETQDIECAPVEKNKIVHSLWIDKKDYQLKINSRDSKTEEFEQVKFLDRGILAKSKTNPSKVLFFQILNKGLIHLHLGKLGKLKESECEDTGASKACKNSSLGELKWTPEKLLLKGPLGRRQVEISGYGHFPNKGTFVFGKEKKKGDFGHFSMLLLDYGAPIEILVGETSLMKCGYVP